MAEFSTISVLLKSTDFTPYMWEIFQKLDNETWASIVEKGYNVVFNEKYNKSYDICDINIKNTNLSNEVGFIDESDGSVKSILNKKQINNTIASANIGYIGEQYIQDILTERYGVNNVTTTGHMGDLIITDTKVPELDIKLMIEIKNYTTKVPTKEIKKFYNDLRTNSSIMAGVFISLKSDITGISSSFEFNNVWQDRNIPVIYLVSHEKDIILAAISILFDYIRLEKSKLINYDICLDQIEHIWTEMKNLADLGNGLSKLRSNIHDIKDHMYKQLNLISDDSWKMETLLKQSINRINESSRLLNYQMTTDLSNINNTYESYDMCDNVEYLLKQFESLIEPNTLLNDKSYKSLITDFVDCVITNIANNNSEIAYMGVVSDKKDIVIIYNDEKIMSISQLKTKIILSINLIGKKIIIPESAEYKKGWVIFAITKFSMRDTIDRDITDLINSL